MIAGRYGVDGGDLFRIGHFRQQQFDAKRAADADRAGHLNIAAHDAGEQPADGQPKSCSGLGLRDAERAAFKGSKDTFEVARLNAGTGIGHLEFSNGAAIVHDQMHTAGLGELDRVGEQVDQNLPQPFFVGINDGG
jgi:hypothetical protein